MTMPRDIGQWTGQLRHILLAACLALGLQGPAYPQLAIDDEETEEQPEIHRYTVELIVFEYTNSALAGNEQFLPEPAPVEEPEAMPPLTFGDPGMNSELPVAVDAPDSSDEELEFVSADDALLDEELEELPSHIIQTQLEVLDPELYAMPGIYEKLVALDAYRPIMRAAWTQATFEKENTLPIKLRRLGNSPLRLDGTVMLYRSRFLRFVVDLTIESRETHTVDPYQDNTRYYGDRWSSTQYGFGYESEAAPIKYTISSDQIFRNGELRYYDHPKLGVLARITRIEEEEPETDELFLMPGDPTPSAAIQ